MNKLGAIAKTLLLGVENYMGGEKNAIFLRAAYVPELQDFPESEHWQMEQSFAPYANVLDEAGYAVKPDFSVLPGSKRAVYILATRFAEENQALLARGWEALEPGGWLVIAQHNDLGAKRLDGLVRQLSGEISAVSKYHCRAIVCRKTHEHITLIREWKRKMQPVTVPGTTLQAGPGMFSWRRVDKGSALLVDSLPPMLAGHGADIASGWGYLSWQLLKKYPLIRSIGLYEAEKLALDQAEKNIHSDKTAFHWCDAAQPLPGIPSGGFDWAVMNPPAHDLCGNAPEVTGALFRQAAMALKPGGCLWLVANRQLPYEETLTKLFSGVIQLQTDNDYKVIEARK